MQLISWTANKLINLINMKNQNIFDLYIYIYEILYIKFEQNLM